MSQAIYSIDNHGNLSNIGRSFQSYDHKIVEQVAGLFLPEGTNKFVVRANKLGEKGSTAYEWNTNSYIFYVQSTPNGHEAFQRCLRILNVDEVEGYCFVVHDHNNLCGVYTSVKALDAFLAQFEAEDLEDFFVRIVPMNEAV